MNPVEQFTTELQILAQDCEFTNTDEMIRDRIVFGTKSMKTREMVFNEGAGEIRRSSQLRTLLKLVVASRT